ncbi:MAG: Gfo/Idh/MocA family oxidoreductase [Armatimonadetes bacterium]|nr:Gfo/Idh/MocA family oxidoreductase [Armatimonadota bacterium]
MAKTYRAAIIGAGSARQGGQYWGMGHGHAQGYVDHPRVELVAIADIQPENARFLAEKLGVPETFDSHRRMLKAVQPDLVSVCTYPATHCAIVTDCAKAGVKAIHSEKPMAPTWAEAQRMVAVCEAQGVQLTFNHQRRFLEPFRVARELAHDGTIGELRRLEATCPNLMDWGTHWFDMLCFLNNETDIEWVIGQIDGRGGHPVFGLPHEGQGLSHFRFANGVRGLLVTGHDAAIGADLRLIGTEGTLEIHNPAPHVRVLTSARKGWKMIKTQEGLHGMEAVSRAIADLVACLGTRREPELAARRALRSTELIFATYESSRRRRRIDLPLKTKDSAFLTLLESGEWAAK